MKIAISLLTLNNLENVKFTLDSLLNSDLRDHDFKLFLWNNQTNNDHFIVFEDYLKSLNIKYYHYPSYKNDGIVIPRIENCKRILEDEMEFDYLLEIHDDMLFPEKWINKLLEFDNPNNAILMPFIFGNFPMKTPQKIVNEVCYSYHEPVIYNKLLQNHPWLIRMDVIKKLGYYDSDFDPQICEDDDFYIRVLNAGYNTVTSKESVVFHVKGNTRLEALGMDGFNLVRFADKHKMNLIHYKQKYLYYDSTDPNLFQGEYGWLQGTLPLPYGLD